MYDHLARSIDGGGGFNGTSNTIDCNTTNVVEGRIECGGCIETEGGVPGIVGGVDHGVDTEGNTLVPSQRKEKKRKGK